MVDPRSWTSYPTPVTPCAELGNGLLWVKNDGLSGTPYGGNKVRKLERLLPGDGDGRVNHVVTAGAAGSHHVLATAVFGRRLGLDVTALLWPMQWNPHAEATLEATLAQGTRVKPVRSALTATLRLATLERQAGTLVLHIGGFGDAATLAYDEAVNELVEDVERGVLPEPERIVVAVGTGTTAAGLLSGVVRSRLRSVVVGVPVARNALARPLVVGMAARALRVRGAAHLIPQLSRRLVLDHARAGGGYGQPTPEGGRAAEMAARVGLELDPTYTAKAFAGALGQAGFPEFCRDSARERLEGPRRTLYWHTLSALPLDPLRGAPDGPAPAPNPFRSLLIDPPPRQAASR
jgi:1-aminocyclopropane-1-carboxylate deaminase/D-cysteine desulfhydrase-like pyridoxal-dependent ACC family enzyme